MEAVDVFIVPAGAGALDTLSLIPCDADAAKMRENGKNKIY